MNNKFDIPSELEDKVFEAIETARATGKLSIGTNETTKTIERGNADLVAIAEDVEPPEIVMHLGPLCEEKDITFVYVEKKDDLGRAAGIDVPTAALAIEELGDAGDLVEEIVDKVKTIKKTE
ncbi:MAG: 50S ribosomal protein L7Ae [Candidatus Aenigmatarchaeota archaeon]